jgi:NADH-quinone oxidoreductase subunit N
LLFIVAAAFTVMVSWDMLDGRARVKVSGIGFRGEYYAVLLFSVCGMMYLVSARDIITLYVSLELATIPLFILTAWRRDNSLSGEAGLKYVILGALASAFMLYGLGLFTALPATPTLIKSAA